MAVLVHPLSADVTPRPIVFSLEYEHRTLAQDREIIDRIIAAYHRGLASATADIRQSMFGTVWAADGFIGHQGELVRALDERSAERTHDILRRYFVSDAAHGIAMGREESEVVKTQPAHMRHYGLMWLDRLVGLAHASGALPLINPEDNMTSWERALEVDVDATVAAIERVLGLPLEFPDVMGVFGGELHGHPIPIIAFTHVLVALAIPPWLPADGTGQVVEIGGGFGDLAYWTSRLVNCRYTIYDLPFANAAQAYFLWRARPGQALRLAGEPPRGGSEIALLPGWELIQAPPASADLVVNQDSLVEIPRGVARAYLKAMHAFLHGPFLSVNHEAWQRIADAVDRTSVAESISAVGGYTRVSRGPFALRAGYAQELYLPSAPGAPGAVRPNALRGALSRLSRMFSPR